MASGDRLPFSFQINYHSLHISAEANFSTTSKFPSFPALQNSKGVSFALVFASSYTTILAGSQSQSFLFWSSIFSRSIQMLSPFLLTDQDYKATFPQLLINMCRVDEKFPSPNLSILLPLKHPSSNATQGVHPNILADHSYMPQLPML